MMYGFELSGEHEKLPEAEILALLETYGVKVAKISRLNRLLLVTLEERMQPDQFSEFLSRIALSHIVIDVFEVVSADFDTIRDAASRMAPSISGSYAVDATVWDEEDLTSTELERSVGALINHESSWVDLEKPDTIVKLYVISKRCVIGRVVHTRSKQEFTERAPKRRPFFAPGVLKPKIARALVNLCHIKPYECLVDPFVGTGGILLEAGLMGIRVIGLDAQEKMITGASRNLEELEEVDLILGDARSVPFKNGSAAGVVTDLPYGRSSKIKGESIDSLYRDAIFEIFRLLKKGRFAVIISDKPIDDIIKKSGFLVIDEYSMRIHRSMTRRIYFLKKDTEVP
ncbi:MAG: RNA methyltransferase [Candidatus Syntrophoarchaeum caldarius]|uniref:tRNA (guanine(10)-N(2))-dimethyltransferase n=1 Tax=Candidatus Syntropharchaeum caldarium TaxID=1838285 RepID=A0A1F2P9M9_9EURY|nr:MAG: RNA methyltransferase [Candidatus Syntrophoarchaeum caldarius]